MSNKYKMKFLNLPLTKKKKEKKKNEKKSKNTIQLQKHF